MRINFNDVKVGDEFMYSMGRRHANDWHRVKVVKVTPTQFVIDLHDFRFRKSDGYRIGLERFSNNAITLDAIDEEKLRASQFMRMRRALANFDYSKPTDNLIEQIYNLLKGV